MAPGINPNDAVNLSQIASFSGDRIQSLDNLCNITANNLPIGITLTGSNIDMNNQKLTNLSVGINPHDSVRYDQITAVP